ncbi:VCBS domain-containing protein [Shewanella insulae]|nr:VCBS domain-containing protein [Shewanella insulae]
MDTVSGKLAASGDTKDDVTWTVETSKGQYGDLVLNPSTGEWHYHLNNFDAKTNALFEGERHNETFTITATDNLGNRVSSVIRVTVEGSNDLPVISGVHHASLNELGSVDRVSGQLIATDPDSGDGVHWAVPHSSGVYGELVIDPDTGVWQYRLDNSSPNTLALHAGQVATETFRVTATDSSGQPVSQIVTIEVHGADQRAIIHGMASGSVTEDRDLVVGQLQTSGLLTVIDPDGGDAHFIATSLQGQYGALTINDLGHWTYTADNSQAAIQGLKSGESLTETLLVHSVDGSEQKVTVTINGTDDRAVIGGTATGAVTEDRDLYQGQLRVDGALTVTDADHGEAQFIATSLQGQYGTLSINDLGHWTYTADNSQAAIQGLKSGDSLTETLYVHSVDGSEQKVTVTINGTDDKAVIGGASTGAVTEDKDLYQGQLRVDGALTVTDADSGQNQFIATTLQGQYGTLTINDLGHWSYTADNSQAAIQGLKAGESLTETLFVHSVDGTAQKVTVTINGTDDKAVIGGAATASVTEDKDLYQGQLRVGGVLTITDADHGETQFIATSLQGQYGTLTINDLGHWTYTADNSQTAIQGLKSGESLTETLFVHSIDGTEQKVTVTINGTDDKAVIGGTSTGIVNEDRDLYQGQLRVDGALTVTDADSGQNQFVATSLQGQYGTLTINDLGHWTYTADNSQAAIQGLKSGESLTETLLVHSVDGADTTVTITIKGTDDKAIIGGLDTAEVHENHSYRDSGNDYTDRSPDHCHGNIAKLWNDTIHIDGKLTIIDPDHNEASFNTQQGKPYTGQYGQVIMQLDGSWSYYVSAGADTVGRKIDQLGEGQSFTDTITVYAKDGTSHDIVITIHGDNDRPYCSSEVLLHSGREDTTQVLTQSQLLQNTVDVDANDLGRLTIENLRADHGSIAANPDGSFTFTPDKDYNGAVHFSYDVKDAHGGITHTGASLSLVAVADAATIKGTDTGAITEDRHVFPDSMHRIQVTGSLSVSDPDAGEDHFRASGAFEHEKAISDPFQGEMHIDQYGNWDYFLANGNPALQALKQGEAKDVIYEVHSADGTPHRITITVTGTNDAPTLAAQTHSVTEDGQRLTGQMQGHDIDHGATLTYSVAQAVEGLTFNPDGSYSFDPSNTAYQHLANGQKQTLTVPVTVTDEHGASATQNLEIVITGTNDAAQISGVDTGAVTEDLHPHAPVQGNYAYKLEARGTLQAIDPDAGESGFEFKTLISAAMHPEWRPYSSHLGGQLSIDPKGNWNYYIDNRKPEIQQLGKDETLTDTVTVHSIDGTTHDIVITIHGTNDAPTVSSEVQLNSGKEDTVQIITASDLLAHATDTDNNDQGQLTVVNLIADHGSIRDNQDGTYTFTPEKDYNGAVHFSYNVKDAHGGITHTGASTTLTAVNDAPDISPFEERVTEGDPQPHAIDLLQGATDKEGDSLSISHLSISVDGRPASSQLPTGVTLAPDGHSLVVDATDPAFEHLAKGQNQAITLSYRVEDGHGGSTEQTAKLIIQGTDDKASLVSNVIQMTETQASDSQKVTYRGHLQLFDPDSGDQTDFAFSGRYIGQGMEPGHLTIWPGGKYEFNLDAALNHHADDLVGSLHSGESMEIPYEIKTSDGQRLTIMVKIIGEDNQARIEVGKYSSLNNHAYEDHLSPGNTPNQIWSGGNLTVIDPDHDQAGFIPQSINTPEGGHFQINASGRWSYTIDNTNVQHLGSNESFNKTFTVTSIDGSASQTISVTVHGTNDKPVISSAVRLGDGHEDTQMRLTPAQLLAHARDVDDNDAGQLTVANLHADHGTITTNPDGSFTFTPDKDYNGEVHFSYDVKDAHGGTTHTSASTTLAAMSDQAQVSGDTRGELAEDQHLDAHNQIAISGQLNVQDPDAGQAAFKAGAATQVDDPFGGSLHIGADGSWTYDVDNARLQQLSEHQEVLVTHRVYTLDGTAQDIVIKITGTNDAPKLGVAQLSSTTGHLTVQDPDSQDTHTFSVAQQTGQFGTLVVDPDTGAYSYRLNQSVAGMHYDKASGQYQGTDTFEVQVSDNHGGSETKFISFDARVSLTAPTGTGQQPQLLATVTQASQLVDTKPQQTPTQTIGNAITLALSHGSDTGASDSDGITHDTHPAVEGQTEIPFSLVTLYEQGNKLTSVLSDAQGHYSVALSGLSEGAHQITASALAPGSQQAVLATPLALTLDTQASIDIKPIAGDNMLQAGEQHQSLTINGTVNNVEEGQSVTVTIGGHQYHTNVHNGCWSTQLSAAEVDALPGGNLEIKAMVSDLAGNHAQMSSPLYVADHAHPIPSMSFLKPPTPTGTGAIGSHISGDLIAPPLLQQLTPNLSTKGAWAIDDGHGHPTLSLRGQYGTLTIDPDTGHVDYLYNQEPTPGDKAAGGTHWAGETISETHHDIFHILYHDSHSSNVDVEVNLDITYIHGHSGHNQQSTQLVDMTVTPITTSPAPPPPPPELHDVPQWGDNQDASDDAQIIVIQANEGEAEDKHAQRAAAQDEEPVNQPHELAVSGAAPSHTEAGTQPLAAATPAPVDHYLQMVGLSQQDLAQIDSHTRPQTDLETPPMPAEHFDADGLTLTPADHFDNPLLEPHEKQGLEHRVIDIDDPVEEHHANANDDDLLHNALNDMHNQF